MFCRTYIVVSCVKLMLCRSYVVVVLCRSYIIVMLHRTYDEVTLSHSLFIYLQYILQGCMISQLLLFCTDALKT